jgi:hypothetical protein
MPDDIESDGGASRQKFVGKWVLCSAVSWLGTSDESGLEFADDGRWYKLYASPSGGLERGGGFDQEGTWLYNGTIVVEIFGGGGTALYPALTTSPRRMRLNNFGVFIGDYIDASLFDGGLGPGTRPDAGTSSDAGFPAECSQGGVPADVPDYATFVTQLTGRWLTCQRPTAFGTSDEAGLEITADGNWFKLYVVASGALERGSGFDRQGTWYPLSMDGGTDQTNFQIFGSGELHTFPAFTHSPRKLRLGGGANDGTYANVVP